MNIFNSVARPKVPKSVHDLSHEHKLSCSMGELVPVACVDVLPGDRIHLDNEALVRFMPMLAPVFDRFNVTFHRFFVPKRLLWDHWDEYVSMTKIGTPAALPVHPYIDIPPADMLASGTFNKVFNYMGVPLVYDPVTQTQTQRVNPMRFAAYQFICNEFYRDQNLIPEYVYKCVDGDNAGIYNDLGILRRRAWSHDYFTGGLPFVQKGDPVMLPVQMSDAPLRANRNALQGIPIPGTDNQVAEHPGTPWQGEPSGTDFVPSVQIGSPDDTTVVKDTDTFYTEGSAAQVQTNLNDLRAANAIQKFKERLARVGSRFTEFLSGVFGVRSRDSRLQRPEYIGGTVKPVTISEVLQTSQVMDTGMQTPQGNMAGHGAAYLSGKRSSYFCEEHGYVITIMNIQPKGAYFQGFDREFHKINHPTEIYTPDLANLGEQATFKNEIYGWHAEGPEAFNYNPRWTEHRFIPNRISGQLGIETKLMYWHAGRFFENMPGFNQTFIECTGEGSSDRIFAVPDPAEEKLVVQIWNTVEMIRPIPKLGTPALIG